MTTASLTVRMRHSRFVNSTTGVWLVILLALVGYIAFHGDSSSSGGVPRADSTATFQLIEAESVVMALPHLTASPTSATVYAALNSGRLLHGQVSYAAKATARELRRACSLRKLTCTGEKFPLPICAGCCAGANTACTES